MNAFTLKPMFYRTPDPISLFSNNEKENKYTKMIALQKLGLTTQCYDMINAETVATLSNRQNQKLQSQKKKLSCQKGMEPMKLYGKYVNIYRHKCNKSFENDKCSVLKSTVWCLPSLAALHQSWIAHLHGDKTKF